MNKEYITSEYYRLHALKKFSGEGLKRYIPEIKELIIQHEIKTMLDYGCGKATYHRVPLTSLVTLYDPYYEPYSKVPEGTFDMVICTDVMEHVPENEVGKMLATLLNYTNKILFLSICTKPAKKTFKNGENVHLTIKPKEWWEDMLKTAKDITTIRHYT